MLLDHQAGDIVMTVLTWLRRLVAGSQNRKNKGSRSRSRWNRWRPFFERLEDRTVPASLIVWNGPDGGTWSNSGNWQGGVVPGSSDTATFLGTTPITVNVDIAASIGSVSFADSAPGAFNLAAAGGSLNFTFAANNTILWHSGNSS